MMAVSAASSVLASPLRSSLSPQPLLNLVDHLIYLTPDLDRSVDEFERLSGIRATAGGSHPGRGTRNALIALGPASYLEIKGPDRTQPDELWKASPFVQQCGLPRLIRWAAKCRNVGHAIAEAHGAGVLIGEARQGQRSRPDGVMLSWTITDPGIILGDGLVPLLIDWGSTLHPAGEASRGAQLVDLMAEHSRPDIVQPLLRQLGIPLFVRRGPEARLTATIMCPNGLVRLN